MCKHGTAVVLTQSETEAWTALAPPSGSTGTLNPVKSSWGRGPDPTPRIVKTVAVF